MIIIMIKMMIWVMMMMMKTKKYDDNAVDKSSILLFQIPLLFARQAHASTSSPWHYSLHTSFLCKHFLAGMTVPKIWINENLQIIT